jgi:hypothetical protein
MMHGLLPLEDYMAYFENVIYIISLGICGACSIKRQWRGKSDPCFTLAFMFVLMSFDERVDYYNNSSMGLAAFLPAIYAAYYISKGGALDEDEDETATPELA